MHHHGEEGMKDDRFRFREVLTKSYFICRYAVFLEAGNGNLICQPFSLLIFACFGRNNLFWCIVAL